MLPREMTLPSAPNAAGLPGSVTQTQTHAVVIAQQFDQDILGDLGSTFKNFIDSGQVWALLIGIVIGYLVRGLTTYK